MIPSSSGTLKVFGISFTLWSVLTSIIIELPLQIIHLSLHLHIQLSRDERKDFFDQVLPFIRLQVLGTPKIIPKVKFQTFDYDSPSLVLAVHNMYFDVSLLMWNICLEKYSHWDVLCSLWNWVAVMCCWGWPEGHVSTHGIPQPLPCPLLDVFHFTGRGGVGLYQSTCSKAPQVIVHGWARVSDPWWISLQIGLGKTCRCSSLAALRARAHVPCVWCIAHRLIIWVIFKWVWILVSVWMLINVVLIGLIM